MSTTPGHQSYPIHAPEMRWRVWPLVDGRPWSLAVAVAPIVAGILVAVTFGATLGLIALAVLVLTMWQFYLPATYEANWRGIMIEGFGRPRIVPWQTIGAIEVRSQGIVLHGSADVVPLDAFRSLFIPWGAHRKELLAVVQQNYGHASRRSQSDSRRKQET